MSASQSSSSDSSESLLRLAPLAAAFDGEAFCELDPLLDTEAGLTDVGAVEAAGLLLRSTYAHTKLYDYCTKPLRSHPIFVQQGIVQLNSRYCSSHLPNAYNW